MIALVASSLDELQAALADPLLAEPAWRWACTGVGQVNAAVQTSKLIAQTNATMLIGIGTCKAIDPSLAIGDVLLVGSCVQYDVDLRRFGLPRGFLPDAHKAATGVLTTAWDCLPASFDRHSMSARVFEHAAVGTSDRFLLASDCAAMPFLTEELHVIAVDMESHAFAAAAQAFGIPWAIVRCVSDTAAGHRPRSYAKFLSQASADLWAIATRMGNC
jgi:adenosylhomocysteine nucleosidase